MLDKISNKLNQRFSREGSTVEKMMLLFFFTLVIGYLLSPKIIFQRSQYHEGDIITSDMIAEKDILLEDRVSTEQKKATLLAELPLYYDYDAQLSAKTVARIRSAFIEVRKSFAELEKEKRAIRKDIEKLGQDFLVNREKLEEANRKEKVFSLILSNNQKQLKGLGAANETKNSFDRQKLLFNIAKQKRFIKVEQQRRTVLLKEGAEILEKLKTEKARQEQNTASIFLKEQEKLQQFISQLEIKIDKENLSLFDFPFYHVELESLLVRFISEGLKEMSLADLSSLPEGKIQPARVKNLSSGEEIQVRDLKKVTTVKVIKEQLLDQVKLLKLREYPIKSLRVLRLLVEKMIRPTLTENRQQFEKQKEEIQNNLSPVYISLKKGEMIARRGEKATLRQVELINVYQQAVSNIGKIPQIVGVFLLAGFGFHLIYRSLKLRKVKEAAQFKTLIMIGVAVLLTVGIVKGSVTISETMSFYYPEIPFGVYTYALPIALCSMLIGVLLNYEAAFMAGIMVSIFVATILQNNLYFFFFGMTGSMVAALPIHNCASRFDLLKQGFKISAVNLVTVVIIVLVESNQFSAAAFWPYLLSAAMGGVIVSVLTTFFLPLFESLFDVTTDLKLLELSNMNHPALKELMIRAPGTYHHSIMVGNLAEAGALKVGGNPLLVRVASYYHDIGKGEMPEYFIENCAPNRGSGHDYLNDPFISAEIIVNHVLEGAKMADRYRLGTAIKDILKQHHGTTMVKYFYFQARKLTEEAGSNPDDVKPDLFTYPGPKPQTIESAVVMIADSCEASTRSLDDPTPENIKEMVYKVTKNMLDDGQMDESGISLKQFHTVVETYIEMLISIHHHRIKYPDHEEKTRAQSGTVLL